MRKFILEKRSRLLSHYILRGPTPLSLAWVRETIEYQVPVPPRVPPTADRACVHSKLIVVFATATPDDDPMCECYVL